MKIQFISNRISFKNNNDKQNLAILLSQMGSDIKYPEPDKNYCQFNEKRVNEIANYKENAIQPLSIYINSSMNHNGIIESLYVVNKLIDNNTKNVEQLYPALSRFNYNGCPHIQTLLAGIYRKLQIPDGFGPLINMLIQNSKYQNKYPRPLFDPNEEIGGAILEYIKNYAAKGYTEK